VNLGGVNNESMKRTSIQKSDPLDTEASQQPRQFMQVSNDLFCMDGEWFFQTPESNHGPFTKREAAEQALERFAEEHA